MLLGCAALAGVHRALDHLVPRLRPTPGSRQTARSPTSLRSRVRSHSCGLSRERWAAVLHGVGLGCLLVCVWALTTKVFPGALAADETYARLREPFGYWNAVGLMAALGVPPLLWLAARRTGRRL